MTFMRYLYHSTMAAILNSLAAMGSYLMRNAGRASNYHEAQAELIELEINRQ